MTTRCRSIRARTAAPTLAPAGVAAFTLIEVMISIALVLALIIGINQVFKVAADTVGTGQALSAKIRDQRAVQQVFYSDLSHAVDTASQAPFFIIDSRAQAAFRDPKDQQGDLDFKTSDTALNQELQILTQDLDGNNIEGELNVKGELMSLSGVSERAHRVDTLSFFAQFLFRRETGNDVTNGPYTQTYIAKMSSNEAWITYGHGRVFNQDYTPANALDNDNQYFAPGAGTAITNPKNYYSSDWVLLREAMLLVPPFSSSANVPVPDRMYDNVTTRNQQRFWMRKSPNGQSQDVERLEPLGRKTEANYTSNSPGVRNSPTTPTPPTISDARFDVAGTTISEMRQRVLTYLDHTGTTPQSPRFAEAWWDVLASSPENPAASLTSQTQNPLGRFRSNPYPARPMDPRKAAQTSGVLLANCSQFIVEYAGDFLTQDDQPYVNGNTSTPNPRYGAIELNTTVSPQTAFVPDGTVDFYVENGVRKTRWYGFPRDVNGDGVILGGAGVTPTQTPSVVQNQMVDVVPLRDIIHSVKLPGGVNIAQQPVNDAMSFEKIVYKDATNAATINAMPMRDDYGRPPNASNANSTNAPDGPNAVDHYTCAWSPNDAVRPTMIRIILRVDDPNGRLSGGQTYEWVINLP